jgi:hypothetical protein
MQKDQFTGPDAPRPPQIALNFRNVPAVTAHVSINGRHFTWLSLLLRPLGRVVIPWFEWRGRRRARNESRTA